MNNSPIAPDIDRSLLEPVDNVNVVSYGNSLDSRLQRLQDKSDELLNQINNIEKGLTKLY